MHATHWLMNNSPFWNATGGRNHIMWATNDRGTCSLQYAPLEMQHSIKVGSKRSCAYRTWGSCACDTHRSTVLGPHYRTGPGALVVLLHGRGRGCCCRRAPPEGTWGYRVVSGGWPLAKALGYAGRWKTRGNRGRRQGVAVTLVPVREEELQAEAGKRRVVTWTSHLTPC